MSDSQQPSRRTSPADDVFFNQDEDRAPASPTYQQPADAHSNGRTFSGQPHIAGNLYRDETADPYYQSDPFGYPVSTPSAPSVPLDTTQSLPVQHAVPNTPPGTPSAPAPATPNQAQPPASPTPDANQAKADKKSRKNKVKGKVRRAALKPFKALGRKLRRHDGLVRVSRCKMAKFYWLLIWAVIPAVMYFLGGTFLRYEETPTGIAAHNPVASYYAHRQIAEDTSNWGPVIIVVATLISITLMTLVRRWDLKHHFGSAMTTNGDGTSRPQLATATGQIDVNRVIHKKAVRRRQFTLLLLVLAIPIVWHLLGQLH